MSSQSIVNWTGNQKIYDSLLPDPYPYPAQANDLAQVLIAGQDAGNQDITNLNELQVTNITQQTPIGGHISLGAAGNTLRVLGATAKGSLLVGNGTDTKELVVGANGLVLTTNSTAPYGVEWAVGGGGGGVASVTAGANVSVTGTATNPIVGVASPLTSTLNIGGQNITGIAPASINIIDVNVPNTQAQFSSTGLSVYDAIGVASNVVNVSKSNMYLQTATDTTTLTSTAITKSAGAGTLTIANSNGPIDMTPVAAGDLNMNVSGAGKVHIIQTGTGGDTQPAISVENNNGNANGVHIDMYKNSSSPAVSDAIGGVSFHGNSSTGVKTEYASIDATIADPTNLLQNGSLALSCCVNSATPTAFLTCNGTGSVGYVETNKALNTLGNSITTTTGSVTLLQTLSGQNVGLSNTAPNGSIIISKTGTGGSIQINSGTNSTLSGASVNISAGTDIFLQPSSGQVQIQQPNTAGSTTKLKTNVTNKEYYPDGFYTNNNTNSQTIPASTIIGERLTLVNYGVTPLFSWNDYPTNFGNITCFWVDTTYNAVWIATGTSIQIYDLTLSTSLGSVSVGGSSYSTTRINAIYGVGGYVYIGGDFTNVNSNAQAQWGLSRINRVSAPYSEDVMYDSSSGCDGVSGYINTITADATNPTDIIFSGFFTSLHNPSPGNFSHMVKVSGTSSSGMNTFTNDSGELSTNNEVYCSIEYSGRNWFGGGFSQVAIYGTNIPANFIASYQTGSSWTQVDSNSFNASVLSLSSSVTGNVLAGGNFNHTTPAYLCYLDASTPSNPYTPVNISPNPIALNGLSGINGFDVVQDGSTQVWSASALNNWIAYGQSNTGQQPSGIAYFNGGIKTSYSTWTFIRTPSANSQTATFAVSGGNYKSGNGTFTNYLFTNANQAQQFIGDGGGNWIPIGTTIGTFS